MRPINLDSERWLGLEEGPGGGAPGVGVGRPPEVCAVRGWPRESQETGGPPRFPQPQEKGSEPGWGARTPTSQQPPELGGFPTWMHSFPHQPIRGPWPWFSPLVLAAQPQGPRDVFPKAMRPEWGGLE